MLQPTASNNNRQAALGLSASIANGAPGNNADVRVVATELYLLPVETRVPLKFGSETLTSVTCARVRITVQGKDGRTATGWGETPLNVEWVWPSSVPYAQRYKKTVDFCRGMARRWASFEAFGHPLEIGHAFQETALAEELKAVNRSASEELRLPLLAALLCCAPFDLAVYDAYGKLHGKKVFETLTPEYLSRDLSAFLEGEGDPKVDFAGKYPAHYLSLPASESMLAWHLVGGLDPLTEHDNASRLDDGHPVLLNDWIVRDGLKCLKIKLRGNDAAWDYARLVSVGHIAAQNGANNLTADFNCMVDDPAYVVDILDKLAENEPGIYESILYIEQPFPYDLEKHQIDVREVSRRKPLLMDERAHNWKLVRLGRSLGWTGVALKTCKTLSGALLSLCWAKAHGMHLMVQDLTNPMLSQIPHLLLAAHSDTIMGVETNAMQFYPSASDLEVAVHPGIYRRQDGRVDLSSLSGPGFGYRVEEIARPLPVPDVAFTAHPAHPDAGVTPPHTNATDAVSNANR